MKEYHGQIISGPRDGEWVTATHNRLTLVIPKDSSSSFSTEVVESEVDTQDYRFDDGKWVPC